MLNEGKEICFHQWYYCKLRRWQYFWWMSKGNSQGKALRFRTTILQAKKTATGISVPEEIVNNLGAGKKPPVKVTINGFTYRSTIAVMGGVYMLGISAAVREQTGMKGGDEIEVSLELDDHPREVSLHPDFKAALVEHKQANAFFESLSFSGKQRYVLPIADAKTEETRQRRIEKAITDLAAGKK